MKLELNRKYTTVAAYAVIVIVISAAVIIGLLHITTVWSIFKRALSLLAPFWWGLSFAYIFDPLMSGIERLLQKWSKNKMGRGLMRVLSMIGTYLFFLIVLAVLFWSILPQIGQSAKSLASQLPSWFDDTDAMLQSLLDRYHLALPVPVIESIGATLEGFIMQMTDFIASSIPKLLSMTLSLTTSVLNFLVGLIISVYVLWNKEVFFARVKKLANAFLKQEQVERIGGIIGRCNKVFGGFIIGKLLDSLIIGLLCLLGMTVFGWPYPMLISVIVGVTNVIPYFGPFIGAIPSILILLLIDPVAAIWFALFILFLQQLDGNVIGPKILGDSTGLSAIWVIFAITVFGGIFGVFGMFIGVPLFSVIYSLIKELAAWRLEKKGLPTKTEDYASEKHPLIERKPVSFKPKTADSPNKK